MNLDSDVLKLLVVLPFAILFLYSLIVVIGNHWILRAGGTSAHENYPKVMGHLKIAFITIFIGFLLFFLTILGYVPSDAVIALVSVAVGLFGYSVVKNK